MGCRMRCMSRKRQQAGTMLEALVQHAAQQLAVAGDCGTQPQAQRPAASPGSAESLSAGWNTLPALLQEGPCRSRLAVVTC